jgi:diphthine-ammonia ligase
MRGMSRPYALMWSGGKDSALALHRARQKGLEVARLVSFYDEATGRVRFHATRVEMLRAQAEAAGIELDAIATSWPDMDRRLREQLRSLREAGLAGVVLGDIHLADVRAWYEERIAAAGLEHVEPLWGEPPSDLLQEFVETGGRAVVTCVDTSRLDRAWLGRVIDQRFVDEIGATAIDPCGENGEYHSFVFAGPVFASSVAWSAGDVRDDGRFVQLDVLAATPDVNQNFRHDVALSRLVDPEPTLRNLSRNTGTSYEDVVHHALVRYASSGAEVLLAVEPWALRQLIEARRAGDWEKVGSLIDWLEAGL